MGTTAAPIPTPRRDTSLYCPLQRSESSPFLHIHRSGAKGAAASPSTSLQRLQRRELPACRSGHISGAAAQPYTPLPPYPLDPPFSPLAHRHQALAVTATGRRSRSQQAGTLLQAPGQDQQDSGPPNQTGLLGALLSTPGHVSPQQEAAGLPSNTAARPGPQPQMAPHWQGSREPSSATGLLRLQAPTRL